MRKTRCCSEPRWNGFHPFVVGRDTPEDLRGSKVDIDSIFRKRAHEPTEGRLEHNRCGSFRTGRDPTGTADGRIRH